jgi:hypothetical protein
MDVSLLSAGYFAHIIGQHHRRPEKNCKSDCSECQRHFISNQPNSLFLPVLIVPCVIQAQENEEVKYSLCKGFIFLRILLFVFLIYKYKLHFL